MRGKKSAPVNSDSGKPAAAGVLPNGRTLRELNSNLSLMLTRAPGAISSTQTHQGR